jgi:hypothetical protein
MVLKHSIMRTSPSVVDTIPLPASPLKGEE